MKKLFLVGAVVFVLAVVLSLVFRPALPQPLVVVGTTPQQQGVHGPFIPITVRFNRAPKTNEYTIDITPKTDYSIVPSNDTIQIRPTTSFLENSRYIITIKTGGEYILSFTTSQVAGSIPGWNEDFNAALDEAKKINGAQDSALYAIRKAVPVTQAAFTINYSYKTDTYTVSLRQPYTQSKASFVDWMNKAGITNLSIVSITYVNQ